MRVAGGLVVCAHKRGEREVPVRGSKSGLISILALGLLAGTAIGVTAQDEAADPVAPVEFTGKTAFGPCPGSETVETLPGKIEYRGEYYCRLGVAEAFSDPRLQGTFYVWPYHDQHLPGPAIWASAFSMTDDDGAWRGAPSLYLDKDSSGTQILVGEGAYEGFTIIASVDLNGSVWDWHGWIIDGDLPPLPTEPEAIP